MKSFVYFILGVGVILYASIVKVDALMQREAWQTAYVAPLIEAHRSIPVDVINPRTVCYAR